MSGQADEPLLYPWQQGWKRACFRARRRSHEPRRKRCKTQREGGMRKILAALLCCWCGSALAQTAQELIDTGKNTDNVPAFGMGYRLNQYSPLNQINKGNVKHLVTVWTNSPHTDRGEHAPPTA